MVRQTEEGEVYEALSVKNVIKTIDESNKNVLTGRKFELKLYKTRWLALGLFVFYSTVNTCQWLQYSIISNIVSRYYDVSSLAVDCTAITFMFYYIPLIFPASYVTNHRSLRWTVILGSCISCLGAWIKVFSVSPDRFYLTFVGQSLTASTQVLLLTVPGRLAAHWFDSRQISTATSIGVFGCQLGIAVGFLFTPMIVRNHSNLEDIGTDLSRLFLSTAILTTVAALMVILFFQDEPKLPPSETRALQKASRSENKEDFLQPMKRLFTNKSFLILCNSYGLNIGVLNAVATLLNQIFLVHFENGEKDAGRIGLSIIIMGMAGSVTFGVILDKTHKFKETTVAVYFLTLCGQILFAIAMCFEVKWMVYVAATFLGFFMSGYLALGYELCAEYTYPEAEGTATGVLNVANNAYGIVLVMLLGKLMEIYGDIAVHVGLCTALLAGFVMTVLTKDEQRRQDARKAVLCDEFSRLDGISNTA